MRKRLLWKAHFQSQNKQCNFSAHLNKNVILNSFTKFTEGKSLCEEFIVLQTICGQKELCSIFLGQPSNLVDLFLDFKAFKVVKLRLVALEGAVNIIFSSTLWLVLALKSETKIRGLVLVEWTEIKQCWILHCVSLPPGNKTFFFKKALCFWNKDLMHIHNLATGHNDLWLFSLKEMINIKGAFYPLNYSMSNSDLTAATSAFKLFSSIGWQKLKMS